MTAVMTIILNLITAAGCTLAALTFAPFLWLLSGVH
jgi:hypothetical protein